MGGPDDTGSDNRREEADEAAGGDAGELSGPISFDGEGEAFPEDVPTEYGGGDEGLPMVLAHALPSRPGVGEEEGGDVAAEAPAPEQALVAHDVGDGDSPEQVEQAPLSQVRSFDAEEEEEADGAAFPEDVATAYDGGLGGARDDSAEDPSVGAELPEEADALHEESPGLAGPSSAASTDRHELSPFDEPEEEEEEDEAEEEEDEAEMASFQEDVPTLTSTLPPTGDDIETSGEPDAAPEVEAADEVDEGDDDEYMLSEEDVPTVRPSPGSAEVAPFPPAPAPIAILDLQRGGEASDTAAFPSPSFDDEPKEPVSLPEVDGTDSDTSSFEVSEGDIVSSEGEGSAAGVDVDAIDAETEAYDVSEHGLPPYEAEAPATLPLPGSGEAGTPTFDVSESDLMDVAEDETEAEGVEGDTAAFVLSHADLVVGDVIDDSAELDLDDPTITESHDSPAEPAEEGASPGGGSEERSSPVAELVEKGDVVSEGPVEPARGRVEEEGFRASTGEASVEDSIEDVLDFAPPSFEMAVEILDEVPPEQEEKLRTEVTSMLRSSLTSITGVERGEGESPETSAVHRELDPSPFVESLRRNPEDRAAFRALQRIYKAQERWDELITLLLEQSEAAPTPARRIELLCDLAELLDSSLGEPEKAQVTLVSAFLLEPRSARVASQLEALTSKAALWANLFAELGQAAATEQHAGRRAALCSRLGDWYLLAGRVDYAQPCFEQALAANPGELRAILGLARLFETTGDVARLAQVQERIPSAMPEDASLDLVMNVALIHERRGDDASATNALDLVLEGDPSHEEALEALERVLGKQARWGDLAARLAQKAERARGTDPDGALELWRRAARLQIEQVGDAKAAEKAARAALELSEADGPSLAILEGIYRQSSRWPELAWVLEKQLAATTSSRERVALLSRLGQMDEEEFLKPEKAVERYRKVLDLEPRNGSVHERVCALLRRQSRWSELVDALERRAAAAPDDASRAQYLSESAEVLSSELGELDRGEELLRKAMRLGQPLGKAASTLAVLLERQGKHEEAFRAFLELAERTADPVEQTRALVNGARIAGDHLGRAEEGLDLLERAVGIDPSQRQAAADLKRGRVQLEDWSGAARALELELKAHPEGAARGRLLVELGQILHGRLARNEAAREVLEQAGAIVGEVRDVVAPLFEIHLDAGRKKEAARLAESLVRTAPKDNAGSLGEDAYRAAKVLLDVGGAERAVPLFERAVEAVPNHRAAIAALAELYEKVNRWQDARASLERLVDVEGGVPATRLVLRQGRAARMCGLEDEARALFEQVLAQDPRNNECLRQLAAIAQGRGELGAALDLLRRVEVTDDEMRLGHLGRMVDLAKEADDDEQLVGILQSLLALKPDDRKSLTLLLDARSRRGEWVDAVETIRKLADLVREDTRARAKYLSAAAVILREKLGDIEGATKTYEIILDEDWENLGVFEAIDKMLTNSRAHDLQQKVYRRMLQRITGKGRTEIEVQLWHGLGEIYRSRLQRFEEAAEAFAAAARIEPDNEQRQLILAELLSALGRTDEAMKRHLELFRLNPERVESLKAARETASATAQYDRAFALVSILAARNQANQAELEFYEQWLPRPIVGASSAVTDENWLVHLRAEEEDPYVTEIFNTILSFALSQRARPAKDFGLGPATAVNFEQQGGGILAQQFVSAARVLGVVIPQLHVLRDQPTPLVYALTDPIASVIGSVLTQLGDQERIFLFGRHLAYYKSGRYLAVAYPSKAELLSVLLSATAAVTGQDGAVPATAKPFLKKLRAWLRSNPHVAERLRGVVKTFLDRGGKVDIDRWLRGVELTACRAGLLLMSDLRAASTALQIDASSPGQVAPKERLDDWARFVASDAYLTVRQSIGVQVG